MLSSLLWICIGMSLGVALSAIRSHIEGGDDRRRIRRTDKIIDDIKRRSGGLHDDS